jgi:hypothetical protein
MVTNFINKDNYLKNKTIKEAYLDLNKISVRKTLHQLKLNDFMPILAFINNTANSPLYFFGVLH